MRRQCITWVAAASILASTALAACDQLALEDAADESVTPARAVAALDAPACDPGPEGELCRGAPRLRDAITVTPAPPLPPVNLTGIDVAYVNYCFAHDDVPALQGAGADVTQIEIGDLAETEGAGSCPLAVVVGAHGCNNDSCGLQLFDDVPGVCASTGDDAADVVASIEAVWDPRPVVIFATCYAGYAQGTISGPVCGVSGYDTIPTSVATQNLLAILHCLANGDADGNGRVSQTEVDACLDARLGTPRAAWCQGIDLAVDGACQ